MTNNSLPMKNPPLDISDYIDKFMNGESVQILDSNMEISGKGRITFSNFYSQVKKYRSFTEIMDMEVTIKDIDNTLRSGNYSLISMVNLEDQYFSLTISENLFTYNNDKLVSNVPFSDFLITEVDKVEYQQFNSFRNELNWSKILIPEGCVGGDKASQADAFESLCQEVVQVWGAKSFRAIGKGPDRGRDGTFLIDAYSWIPIETNYSNSWILQCKYSIKYKNLEIDEIYSEMVKVLMHKPDYYLLMTNRKVTNDFEDWFRETVNGIKYHIPFKAILIGRTQLEQVLSNPEMIHLRRKYFGY